MNLDAILRIGAKVTGTEQIAQLQSKLRTVEGAASSLTSRAGILGGALGSLAPVVTIGGLTALIGKTIQAGDEMHDLSQRTGVGVEALAKFKKAAVTSGTDIDTVAKNLAKLSKGLYETAQTGKGATAEALAALGVNAKDAAGNLKSADQVTLEIANKFKTMPDGAKKTALAMQLFGRSGAEMVPLLNMGGDAIDRLKVKMTGAFAEKADEYSDKLAALSGKVGGLAAGLTVALLPALDLIASGVAAVIDGFGKLPGPIQAVVGTVALLGVGFTALTPIIASVLMVLGAFQGLTIGATIAGWLGALGPLMAGLSAFATALVGWPLLIGAALVGVGVLIFAFRDEIGGVVGAIGKTIYGTVDSINKTIRNGIGATWNWLSKSIGSVASGLAQPFEAAGGMIKSVLRNVVGFATNAINSFLGVVNQMIGAANSVAARLRLPTLPTLGQVQVPSFAGGGSTGNAPRSGGLDGQGGFIAMLHPRETIIDHASGAGGGASNITVPIQTGPVYRLPDGTDTVSLADFHAGMKSLAVGIMAQLGTPAGRVVLRGA